VRFRLILIGLFFIPLFAKEVIFYVGKTYPFAEENFIVAIHNYIRTHKKEIEKKLAKIRQKAKEQIKEWKPKGIDPLTPARKNRVFYPDLTYTLPFDIKDQYGRVIYPKGFKFNPARYVHLSYGIIVINANRKKEIEWLKKSGYLHSIAWRIFITDGSWYDTIKELKQQVYYCLPQIEKRFKLKHTPSIITQVGDKIRVQEICLDCNNSKK